MAIFIIINVGFILIWGPMLMSMYNQSFQKSTHMGRTIWNINPSNVKYFIVYSIVALMTLAIINVLIYAIQCSID
jgi:hypothetical protein